MDFPQLPLEVLRTMKRQADAPHLPRGLHQRLGSHPAFLDLTPVDVLLTLQQLEAQQLVLSYQDHLSAQQVWKLTPLGKLHAPK
jgi:hypothetical protein